MIQFTEVLADAYVSPARNVAMPSLPGRQVKFLQGHAAIKDGRDLAAMLRRSDVKLVLTDYALSWIEEIERAAGQVLADVRRPQAEESVSDRQSASVFNNTEPSKPVWDPRTFPRDPKTGRLLPRKPIATERPEPDS